MPAQPLTDAEVTHRTRAIRDGRNRGLSWVEIADSLGMNPTTLKSWANLNKVIDAPRRHYTPEENWDLIGAQVKQLRALGTSWETVASKVHRTRRTVRSLVEQFAPELLIDLRLTPPPILCDEEIELRRATIIDGLRDGLTWGRIGTAIGITGSAAAKWAADNLGQPSIDQLRAEHRNRRTVEARRARSVPPRLVPTGAGWALWCGRHDWHQPRLYPSRNRARRALRLHERCCRGAD